METIAFENIQQRLDQLDNREIKLTERELTLEMPLSEQNERFEKLRKGYVSLRLIENEAENEFQPLTRDTFELMLKILKNKYNIDDIQLEKLDDRNKVEQYFTELIPLIQNRWSSICGYKRLWKERRIGYRQAINTLLDNDIRKLAENIDANDQSKWINNVEIIFSKLDKLIKDIEDLLTSTESLQTELEDIFKQREEIFVKADLLFRM
ncbi:MAG: hypothetical protein ACOYMD_02500 [Paludibacter sp.]